MANEGRDWTHVHGEVPIQPLLEPRHDIEMHLPQQHNFDTPPPLLVLIPPSPLPVLNPRPDILYYSTKRLLDRLTRSSRLGP